MLCTNIFYSFFVARSFFVLTPNYHVHATPLRNSCNFRSELVIYVVMIEFKLICVRLELFLLVDSLTYVSEPLS